MQGDDEIVAIVKLLQRQATLLNLISLQLGDQACMLIPTLEVCGRCDRDPITVEHRLMGLQTCDRCAAELIVKSGGKNYTDAYMEDPGDPLNAVRSSLMNEQDWVDRPDAEKIRRVLDFVRVIKEFEVHPGTQH